MSDQETCDVAAEPEEKTDTNTNTHAHTHTKTRKAVSRCSGDVVVTDGQEIVDAVTGIGKIRTQLVLYNTPIISVQCIPVPGATGGE